MATNGQLTLEDQRQLFLELNSIRQTNDWTYLKLREAILKVTGHTRDEDCLRRICLGQTTQPQERTVNIIEKFVASVRPNGKRRIRRAS